MIRHKATGMELAWRPSLDRQGREGTGWALASADNSLIVMFAYADALDYRHRTKEGALERAIELGVVEVIPNESLPNDYDAIHRADEIDQAIDEHNQLLEDARALAIRLFLAGHDEAAAALRRLL